MSRYALTYIYHDCFMLELDEAVFLFDFWKDPLSTGSSKDFPPIFDDLKATKKPIYILVSHHHKDHYSKRVFLWSEVLPEIKYIISEDVFRHSRYLFSDSGIYAGFRPSADSVTVLSSGQSYIDDIVKIKAFGSTDIGNSYALDCGGKSFFHAGDLNAWLWIGENPEEEIEEERRKFISIVDTIKKDFPFFNLVMFPVDSRLGQDYWWGASFFVRAIDCELFIPMHFELVIDEKDKQQRRIDAAAFSLFARSDYGAYLQLSSTRSCYLSNS